MIQRNYCMDILIENATSYTEKSKIYSLTEAEQAIVNDKMVGNLYKSAIRRKDIDVVQTKRGTLVANIKVTNKVDYTIDSYSLVLFNGGER